MEFDPIASEELLEALDWYLQINNKTGVWFQDEINGQLNRILETPKQFPIVFSKIRRANIHSFPYSILFEVYNDSILILSIFHQSRDPQIWKTRR